MCVKLLKSFVVFALVFAVSSPLFAWAIKPSAPAKIAIVDSITLETEEVNPQPQITPTKEQSEVSKLLEDVTAKTRLTKEQAEAIVTLRDAIDELKEINDSYEAENTALYAKVEAIQKANSKARFGLGLGTTFTPNMDNEIKDMFGAKIVGTVRDGKNMIMVGVEYPEVAKIMDFDSTKLGYSVTFIREF